MQVRTCEICGKKTRMYFRVANRLFKTVKPEYYVKSWFPVRDWRICYDCFQKIWNEYLLKNK